MAAFNEVLSQLNKFIGVDISKFANRQAYKKFIKDNNIIGVKYDNYKKRMSDPGVKPIFSKTTPTMNTQYFGIPKDNGGYYFIPNPTRSNLDTTQTAIKETFKSNIYTPTTNADIANIMTGHGSETESVSHDFIRKYLDQKKTYKIVSPAEGHVNSNGSVTFTKMGQIDVGNGRKIQNLSDSNYIKDTEPSAPAPSRPATAPEPKSTPVQPQATTREPAPEDQIRENSEAKHNPETSKTQVEASARQSSSPSSRPQSEPEPIRQQVHEQPRQQPPPAQEAAQQQAEADQRAARQQPRQQQSAQETAQQQAEAEQSRMGASGAEQSANSGFTGNTRSGRFYDDASWQTIDVDDFINNAANKVDNADFSASLGNSWNSAKAKIDDVLSRVGHGGGEPPKRNGGSAHGSAGGDGSSSGAESDEGGVNKYHAAALVGLGALGVAALAASSANTGPMSNDQLYSDPF